MIPYCTFRSQNSQNEFRCTCPDLRCNISFNRTDPLLKCWGPAYETDPHLIVMFGIQVLSHKASSLHLRSDT